MSPAHHTRRQFLSQLAVVPLMAKTQSPPFKRIDIQTWVNADAPYVRDILDAINLKVLNVRIPSLQYPPISAFARSAAELTAAWPRYYAWATTFDIELIRKRDGIVEVVAALQHDFDKGALAVQVPGNIGRQAIDSKGRLMAPDHPAFEPILELVEREKKALLTGIFDPRITGYLSRRPPGSDMKFMASTSQAAIDYDEMTRGQDRVVAKHPSLRVIAQWFGGTDIDQVAQRFNRYPNFAVDTAAAVSFLSGQSVEKVRGLFLDYPDRFIYATGSHLGPVSSEFLNTKNPKLMKPAEIDRYTQFLLTRYARDHAYYARSRSEVAEHTVAGLELPQDVLQQLYYTNAVRWLPGIEAQF